MTGWSCVDDYKKHADDVSREKCPIIATIRSGSTLLLFSNHSEYHVKPDEKK